MLSSPLQILLLMAARRINPLAESGACVVSRLADGSHDCGPVADHRFPTERPSYLCNNSLKVFHHTVKHRVYFIDLDDQEIAGLHH